MFHVSRAFFYATSFMGGLRCGCDVMTTMARKNYFVKRSGSSFVSFLLFSLFLARDEGKAIRNLLNANK